MSKAFSILTPRRPAILIFGLGASKMRIAAMVLLIAATLGPEGPALAQTLSTPKLTSLTFDQKLNAQLDLSLPFTDEKGHSVKLGDYFGKKPVVLDLGYYECPMLCGLVLNGMIESFREMKPIAGKAFEVVFVSIAPSESPAIAAAKKQSCLADYGHPEAASGWHFLTGQAPAIKALADSVGFHYAYDKALDQYAHPSGIIIVTPQGKVSKYFFGVQFSAPDLQTAVTDAQAKKVGSPVEQLLLLCCSFLPLVGKYSKTILLVVKVLSMLFVVALVGYIIMAAIKSSKAPPAPVPTEAEGREP